MHEPNDASSTSICARYTEESGPILVIARLVGICGRAVEEKPPPQRLKIFVAGLSKTGTSSMKLALERLGYKVYHMSELVGQHLHVWKEAARAHRAGKRGNASIILDALAADGYNATTDLPTAFFWREALQRYPDAKFILTQRDTAEKYVHSWETMQRGCGHLVKGLLQAVPMLRDFKEVTDWWATLYPGLSPEEGRALAYDFEPVSRMAMGHEGLTVLRDNCKRSYEQHNDDVIRGIPSEQLLVFNVKQGFADGTLCRFLDVPAAECPTVFPHSNDNTVFKPLAVVLLWTRFSWVWAPLLMVGCCSWPRRARRKRAPLKRA